MSLNKISKISTFLLGVIIGSSLVFVFYSQNTFCPNKIITLFDRDYFDEVHELLSSANESVHIAIFEMKYYPNYPGSLENRLVEDLIEARRRGVDVYVIVDEYARGSNETVALLKENGINAKLDSKSVTTHVKLLIIDGKIVVIGSTNWSYYALEKNHEASVVIFSRDVAKRFDEYFWMIWRE